jgi:hypothetical protein
MDKTLAAPRPWALLVSSFDDSSDLWPLFFHFLFKYWPDVPTPIYLITNFKIYDDPRVVSLAVGRDTSWGDCMTRAIGQIPAENFWLLLDDFFLKTQMGTPRIQDLFEQWKSVGGLYLETGRQGDVGTEIPGTDLRRMSSGNAIAGINSAMYEREFLLDLARPGLSLWDANTRLTTMNRENHPDFYYLRREIPPMIEFVESVKGKFWKPEAMEFLEKEGVKPDLRWRPYPPQGRDFFGKLVRSYYKQRMNRRKKREEAALASGRGKVQVKPYSNS